MGERWLSFEETIQVVIRHSAAPDRAWARLSARIKADKLSLSWRDDGGIRYRVKHVEDIGAGGVWALTEWPNIWGRPLTRRKWLAREKLEFNEGELLEWLEKSARRRKQKSKPGPKRGEVKRYGAADEKLFPQITRRLARGETLTTITQSLADSGKVKGAGESKSLAARLRRAYRAKYPR